MLVSVQPLIQNVLIYFYSFDTFDYCWIRCHIFLNTWYWQSTKLSTPLPNFLLRHTYKVGKWGLILLSQVQSCHYSTGLYCCIHSCELWLNLSFQDRHCVEEPESFLGWRVHPAPPHGVPLTVLSRHGRGHDWVNCHPKFSQNHSILFSPKFWLMELGSCFKVL